MAQPPPGSRNATVMLINHPPASSADGDRMLTNEQTNQRTNKHDGLQYLVADVNFAHLYKCYLLNNFYRAYAQHWYYSNRPNALQSYAETMIAYEEKV